MKMEVPLLGGPQDGGTVEVETRMPPREIVFPEPAPIVFNPSEIEEPKVLIKQHRYLLHTNGVRFAYKYVSPYKERKSS